MFIHLIKIFTLLVFFFQFIPVFCSTPEIDSLQKAYDNAKSEKDKRQSQWLLGKAYVFIDPSKAIELSSDALSYYEKKKDIESCVNILNTLGIANAIKGDYKNSESAFLKRLKLSRELGDSISVAGTFSALGNVYHSISKYKKSIRYYKEALRIFESEGNTDGMATVYANLGNAYKAEGNYQQALETFFRALELTEKLKKNTGTILSNIGNIFADMGNPAKAKIYFEKSIEQFKKDGSDYYVAWSYSNLASVYFDEGDIKKSEEYYNKAFVIHKEQEDQEGIAHTNHALGNIRVKRKKYGEAEKFYETSVSGYQTIGLNFEFAKVYMDWGLMEMQRGDTGKAAILFEKAFHEKEFFAYDFELAELYQVMSKAAIWKRDFKNALYYHEQHTVVRDSVYKMETTREFAEKEAKYQNEKKQKENEILQQKNKINELNTQQAEEENQRQKERTNMLVLFGVIGAVLLSTVIVVLIRSNRLKQQTNQLLQDQNLKITHQKGIIEEKNKDITASINYAQNIQQAILPDVATARHILGESFILFMPRDIVSGDFYWMHKMENGDIFFAVADCTGHGVPGAFMSMMGNDMLNKIVVDHGISDPGKALTELNKEVKKALAKNVSADKMRDGMDIMFCKIYPDRNKLAYAAAMRSMYHISGNSLKELKGDKSAIGGNTEMNFNFTTYEINISGADSLYLTTDGFADQFGGADGKKFMSKNLKDLFLQLCPLPMEKQGDLLKENFIRWKGSYEQIDDVTVMGIKI